jgi:hypothetical protein
VTGHSRFKPQATCEFHRPARKGVSVRHG